MIKDINILHKEEEANRLFTIAESIKTSSLCPRCGISSSIKHSRYTRKISLGSFDGINHEIQIIVGKFKCINDECSQKIFSERLDFVSTYGRRSKQVMEIITSLSVVTSAEKVSVLMKKLGISISNDTVLRTIKKLPLPKRVDKIINIGVDDFALKKGNKYGTIICNLDTKKIIDVLPGRTKNDLANWLSKYPDIKLVSRDGALSYATAVNEAIPNAKQVSDKFHLIKNLLDAISIYIRRNYPLNISLKNSVDTRQDIIEINNREVSKKYSQELSKAEILRNQKIDIKWKLITEIKTKHSEGMSIKELAKDYSMSRNTIRGYLTTDKPIYYTSRIKKGSKLDKYKKIIIELLNQNKTHQEITDIIKEQEYDGSRSQLSSYMSRNNIKKSNLKNLYINEAIYQPNDQYMNRNYMIKLICKNTKNLTDSEVNNLNKIIQEYPDIHDLNMIINDFKNLFKEENCKDLDDWIIKAKEFKIHELDSFVNGLIRDIDAVRNSMKSKYTNGLLEGIINKVKVVKRISYGRCNFDLLRLKILYA